MKERSTNEKVSIVIICIMLSIIIIVLLLYFLGILGKEKPSANIIVDNKVMFKYTKKKWELVEKKDYSKYNWNKVDVYEEGEKKGRLSLFSNDGKWYLFEEKNGERTPIKVVGDSIYLGGRIDTKFINFEKTQVNSEDIKYIRKVLDYYKVDREEQNNYTYRYKVEYDFDNDGKKEELFVVSNMFSDKPIENTYSFIFINNDGKTKMLYNKIYKGNMNMGGCYAYLYGIIQVEKTKVPQIVTKCSYYSVTIDNEYGLYQFNRNNYELLLYSKKM